MTDTRIRERYVHIIYTRSKSTLKFERYFLVVRAALALRHVGRARRHYGLPESSKTVRCQGITMEMVVVPHPPRRGRGSVM